MTIESVAAGLEFGKSIELIEIDLTPIGGGFYRIYNGFDINNPTNITFKGVTWNPNPFISEGWEKDATGKTPRPIITIADYDGILLAELINDDLIGLQLKRYETTEALLSSNSAYGPETWLINQKQEADGFFIKFNLASPLDQKNKKLPNRQMFKDEFPALARNRVRGV